jgi:hypothetical protein
MMDQALKDKICRTVYDRLKNPKTKDLMALADRIADDIELVWRMETEESGIASVTPDQEAGSIWDMDDMQPVNMLAPPVPRGAIVSRDPKLPPKEGRLLVLPGDKEFAESKPPEIKPRNTVSAIDIRKRSQKRPGANVPETQFWDYGDLTEQILAHTNEKITFEIVGPEGEPMTLPAIRNVVSQIGMGSVVLSYRHPSVSLDVTGAVTLDLIAKKSFSLYDKELDFDAAMESIMVQLHGMYRVRPEHMEPQSGPAPGPLRAGRSNPMGDAARIDINAGETYADPKGDALRALRQGNDSLAPQGRRF